MRTKTGKSHANFELVPEICGQIIYLILEIWILRDSDDVSSLNCHSEARTVNSSQCQFNLHISSASIQTANPWALSRSRSRRHVTFESWL
jgi:hypothetical protein